MFKIYETFTLELWNSDKFKHYTEAAIAGMDAPVRLLCPEPVIVGRGFCGAHFHFVTYFISSITGEKLALIQCNACGEYKHRRLGCSIAIELH